VSAITRCRFHGTLMRSVATLEDGTALYAPRGELPYDPVADLVQCHLCGRWYRALGRMSAATGGRLTSTR
jgi:hypothetical protein